ncbi:MAG: N-6 DNA methylase [Chitinophagaceae bacterium]
MAKDINTTNKDITAFIDTLREADPHGYHRVTELFRDFVHSAALAFRQKAYIFMNGEPNMEWEAEYMELERKYPNFKPAFPKAVAIMVTALDEELYDFLGQAYMALEQYNERAGQFFTPQSVSDLIAKQLFQVEKEAFHEEYNSGPLVHRRRCMIHEPACGAGGMMLAITKEMKAIDAPPWKWWFEAIDIDPMCVHMTYIQLSVAGAPGFVFQGNTLGPNLGRDNEPWRTIAGAMFPLRQGNIDANEAAHKEAARKARGPLKLPLNIKRVARIATVANEPAPPVETKPLLKLPLLRKPIPRKKD